MSYPKKLTPAQLWEHFETYVTKEKAQPWIKIEYAGKDGDQKKTPLQVPITFEGFECYLQDQEVIRDLGDYSANTDDAYKDYVPVIARIRNNCFVQNFKGASVGMFNAAIIAKKLGLIERINQNVSNIPILNIDPLDDSTNNSSTKDSKTP
jgi:hypothetical protein